jgi:hypothetical protein
MTKQPPAKLPAFSSEQPADPPPVATPEPASDLPASPSPVPSGDPRRPTSETTAATSPETAASRPQVGTARSLLGLSSQRLDGAATRTPTSSAGDDGPPPIKLDKKTATAATIAAVGLAAAAAALFVRFRFKGERVLREPTDAEAAEIAGPLASLMMRHASMAKSLPDVIDVLSAIGATGSYMNAGPLTRPVTRGHATAMPQQDEENAR